jgi:WD repeat-containing protein 23
MSSCQDQHIRLYNTEKSKFCCFKNIKAKEVGWTIVDVSYSPDQNYLIYSSWCDSIYLCSVHKDSDTHIPLHLRPDSMYRFCPFSIRFSQDNREILAGANDGCLYIYDREQDERILRVLGHDDHINSVAFADNSSNILITASDDGIVSVWDRRTLSELNPQSVGQFAGHGAGLVFIDPKGDGRHLISNSKDQSIKLWDIRRFSSKSAVTHAKQLVAAEHETWDYRWQSPPKKFWTNWKMEGDSSLMTYKGHNVSKCQIRCRFSPAHTTGQQYIYSGCAASNLICEYHILPHVT